MSRRDELTVYKNENKDYKLTLMYDENNDSPRSWGPDSHMVCFHNRYDLSNETDVTTNDFDTWEGLEKILIKDYGAKVILPMYMYDHSGVTVNTTGFTSRWDSGRIGFIYMDKVDIHRVFGYSRLTAKRLEKVEQRLRDDVAIYDQYLRGDIYQVIVEKLTYNKEENRMDEEIIDSIGGFYGCDDKDIFVDNIVCNLELDQKIANELLEDYR